MQLHHARRIRSARRAHSLNLQFQPTLKFSYISIAAFIFGIILTAHVIYSRFLGQSRSALPQ